MADNDSGLIIVDDDDNKGELPTAAQINDAIKAVALGTAQRRHEVHETLAPDGYGGHERVVREANSDAPNIPLLLKLMEDRIGGPQDYC